MTFGEVLWFLWCLFWVLVWGTVGMAIFPLNIVLILVSVLLALPALFRRDRDRWRRF
jgi:hypothetical protein